MLLAQCANFAHPNPNLSPSRGKEYQRHCRESNPTDDLPASCRFHYSFKLPVVHANPYLPKPGEAPISARVGTCSITGGFIHFYSALFNGLFDKYGLKVEHVTLRGGVVSLAALSADEIQFIYCSADPMIPRMAAGADAKMIGSTIVGLPWVLGGPQRHLAGRRISRAKASRSRDPAGSPTNWQSR